MNKNSEERIRIEVDVEGYLRGQREQSGKSCQKAGKQIQAQAARFLHFGADECPWAEEIVHLALKDDSEVRTQSMGDGFYRKLVIFPKRRNFRLKMY
ncbi:MAG: hypothetical protein R2941_16335 [Desulfobacterales bacterium]